MDAKTYYHATGGTALASLTELTNIKDLTLSLEAGEADVTTRANSGWKATGATLKEASVEFEMVWLPSDAGFAAIRDAFLNSTVIALAVLDDDRDTVGSEGLRGDFSVTGFSRNEALEEAITVSVTLKLAVFTEWVEVASSSSA
jgi:hypothetical protein